MPQKHASHTPPLPRNHRGPHGGRRGRGGPGGGRRKRDEKPAEELHPTADAPDVEDFRHWDLHPAVLGVIDAMGIHRPTPIQALAIGPVLEGRDVIAKAETGTGKTLAFGAPILSRVDADRSTVLALVLCPTRELAQQVAGVLEELGRPRDVTVALVVGGDEMHPQVEALRAGAQVVVGTPGRVLDLYQQRFLQFPWTEYVVLDEADEMLEIGFLPDVQKILSYTPDERQTLLFSATFPPELLRLARAETREPVEVATARGLATVENIRQSAIDIGSMDRATALVRLIETSDDKDVFLVFCERRTDVDRLMRRLERLPYGIKSLHGGYDQAARFRVMSAFRTGEVKALVATDVASRGLDIAHVTHVVNLHPPKDVSDYTHRIGRTGRAGRAGHAITLVADEDAHVWRSLRRGMKWDVEEMELPPRGGRWRPRGEETRGETEERQERGGRRRHSRREVEPHEAREDRRREREPVPVESERSEERGQRDSGSRRGRRGGRRRRSPAEDPREAEERPAERAAAGSREGRGNGASERERGERPRRQRDGEGRARERGEERPQREREDRGQPAFGAVDPPRSSDRSSREGTSNERRRERGHAPEAGRSDRSGRARPSDPSSSGFGAGL